MTIPSISATSDLIKLFFAISFYLASCSLKAQDEPPQPLAPPIPEAEVLISAAGPYGNAYLPDANIYVSVVNFDHDFQTLYPTTDTFDTELVTRDLRVRFTEKAGETNDTKNATTVTINGVQHTITDDFFGAQERRQDFIVRRDWLNQGANIFNFGSKFRGSSQVWGIKDVLIEYLPSVSLDVGVADSAVYGSDSTPVYATGLRANFEVDSQTNNLDLEVTGWDIDTASEINVYLNGIDVGSLSTSSNNNYNNGQTIILRKQNLVSGLNIIEFSNTNPGSPWRIKDLLLSNQSSIDITPVLMLLLDSVE